jgi:16S rRNA (guanine527-N7)-methyltransferase
MEKLESGARKLGIDLSPEQLELFNTYYQELAAWNQRINLTGITGYEDVQLKHFLDSLTAAPLVETRRGGSQRIIDVGTGGGLPGIPLKIARPGVRLALLEATAKKANFLRHLISMLGLEDTEVITGRAEEAARDAVCREAFDIALSRALAPLPTLVEFTLPFVTVGGGVVAWKKGDIEDEIEGASKAIEVLGGKLREVRAIELEGLNDGRVLVIIDKVSPTPPEYPRRPGIPAKRPIA